MEQRLLIWTQDTSHCPQQPAKTLPVPSLFQAILIKQLTIMLGINVSAKVPVEQTEPPFA